MVRNLEMASNFGGEIDFRNSLEKKLSGSESNDPNDKSKVSNKIIIKL